MKSLFFSLIFTSLITSAYACEDNEIAFTKNNICVKTQWINGPSYNQFNSMAVTLSNETSLKLNVIPWMVMTEGHEHGSRPVNVIANSNRDYIVEKIYFMSGMMGQWYLRYQLINNQNAVVEEVRTAVGPF
jgi:hypothetical protein